jgi:hypothetical protein
MAFERGFDLLAFRARRKQDCTAGAADPQAHFRAKVTHFAPFF